MRKFLVMILGLIFSGQVMGNGACYGGLKYVKKVTRFNNDINLRKKSSWLRADSADKCIRVLKNIEKNLRSNFSPRHDKETAIIKYQFIKMDFSIEEGIVLIKPKLSLN